MAELKNREIAFIGKMTASITHEMRNVLAIIQESSGLMEDLIDLCQKTPFPYMDKMQDALTHIQGQVKRGVELTDRLNRFAHDSDETIKTIDLNDMVTHLAALSQRHARLKNVLLKAHSPGSAIWVKTSPIQLQMALFAGVECCLSLMATGGEIHLSPQGRGTKNLIHILCDGNDLEKIPFVESLSKSGKWATLKKLVECLGGSVAPDESARGIFIFLPKTNQSPPSV